METQVRTPIPVWVWVLLVATLALVVLNFPFQAVADRRAINETLNQLELEGLPRSLVELNTSYAYPPGLNAAHVYTNAFSNMAVGPDVKETVPGFGSIDLQVLIDRSDPEALTSAQRLLDANAFALELLREGNRIAECRYSTDLRKGFDALLPHLQDVRSGCRLFSLQAVIRLSREEWLEAFGNIRNGLQLAQSLEQEPLILSQLVRFSALKSTIAAMESFLNQSALSFDQIEVLERLLLASIDPGSMEKAVLGELCIVEDLYQSGPIGLLKLGKTQEEKSKLEAGKIRAGTRALYGRDFRFFLESINETLQSEWFRSQNEIGHLLLMDQRLEQLRESSEHRDYYLTKRLLPGVSKTLEREVRLVVIVREVLLSLALERYRLNNEGALPESLDELPESENPRAFLDPFTAKPLHYERLERGFQVSSPGRLNATIDASESDEESDEVIRFTIAR